MCNLHGETAATLNKTKSQTIERSSVWQPKGLAVSQIELSSFDNFSALNAACTRFNASIAAAGKLHPDGLKIRVKPPSRLIVSV